MIDNDTSSFQEELKYLSGRRMERITRRHLDRTKGFTGEHKRMRPPRMVLNAVERAFRHYKRNYQPPDEKNMATKVMRRRKTS